MGVQTIDSRLLAPALEACATYHAHVACQLDVLSDFLKYLMIKFALVSSGLSTDRGDFFVRVSLIFLFF